MGKTGVQPSLQAFVLELPQDALATVYEMSLLAMVPWCHASAAPGDSTSQILPMQVHA